MTFDPTIPAPILDEHIRRISAYLLVVKNHEQYAQRIAEDLGIPRGTLSNSFFAARAQLAGIEPIRLPSSRGRRPSYAGYRLTDPPAA